MPAQNAVLCCSAKAARGSAAMGRRPQSFKSGRSRHPSKSSEAEAGSIGLFMAVDKTLWRSMNEIDPRCRCRRSQRCHSSGKPSPSQAFPTVSGRHDASPSSVNV